MGQSAAEKDRRIKKLLEEVAALKRQIEGVIHRTVAMI